METEGRELATGTDDTTVGSGDTVALRILLIHLHPIHTMPHG